MSPNSTEMAHAPQIQAGKLVADYLDHKLSFEQINTKLEPLGFAFCLDCYAHRPIGHEDHLREWWWVR